MNFPFKKPKKVGKCRNKNLAKFAAKVKKNVVKSEVWFNNLYKKLEHSDDRFNEPFQSKYIPDVTNHKYKYIIEIDGSIHNEEYIKKKDKIKDQFYVQRGYRVFRIKAYDKNNFNQVIYDLYKIRDIPYLTVCLRNRKKR